MRALHLCFQLHRPYGFKLDGLPTEYFSGEADFREADRLEYQPFFALMERSTQKYENLKFSLAVSGTWLEEAEKWCPDLITRIRKLVNMGRVDLLLSPYDFSLAWFYDQDEFKAQVEHMRKKLGDAFGITPEVFAMPELIYNDKIAAWAEELKLKGVVAGGAEAVLDFRTPNQVFEAEGCKRIRVLFQNTRFSEALRLASAISVVEEEKVEVKLNETTPEQALAAQVPLKLRKKITAEEFIRSRNGATHPEKSGKKAAKKRKGSGQLVFSSRKFQKELDIELLRGNLMTLALDTRIFSEYREMKIVRFFDELFASWLQVEGNYCYSASEMLEAMRPTTTISIKTTIDRRSRIFKKGQDEAAADYGVIARLKDINFCPPKWLSNVNQIKVCRQLYELRPEIYKTEDTELIADFQRFTALDYLIPMNPQAPRLVRSDNFQEYEAAYDTYMKVIERFMKNVDEKHPLPLRLTAGWKLAEKATDTAEEGPEVTDEGAEIKEEAEVKETAEVEVVQSKEADGQAGEGEQDDKEPDGNEKTKSTTSDGEKVAGDDKVVEDELPEIITVKWIKSKPKPAESGAELITVKRVKKPVTETPVVPATPIAPTDEEAEIITVHRKPGASRPGGRRASVPKRSPRRGGGAGFGAFGAGFGAGFMANNPPQPSYPNNAATRTSSGLDFEEFGGFGYMDEAEAVEEVPVHLRHPKKSKPKAHSIVIDTNEAPEPVSVSFGNKREETKAVDLNGTDERAEEFVLDNDSGAEDEFEFNGPVQDSASDETDDNNEDWDELDWDDENWISPEDYDSAFFDYVINNDDDFVDEDEMIETTAMDDAEAEMQILAQRISRKQEESPNNLDELEEAEIIE